MDSARLSPDQVAQFLAGKAVAAASDYLGGRIDQAQLLREANALQLKLMTDAGGGSNAVLDPVRLLMVAMMRTAVAHGADRLASWSAVTGALVELVRHESAELAAAATRETRR